MRGHRTPGRIRGLFVLPRPRGHIGSQLDVAVGTGDVSTAFIGPDAAEAFETARNAVAGWLERLSGTAVPPHGPWLGTLVPTHPRARLPTDGSSVGLAYALAIVSCLLNEPLPVALCVTGRIGADASVLSNEEPLLTRIKIEVTTKLDPAAQMVMLPSADQQVARQAIKQRGLLRPVSTLDEAVHVAFGRRAGSLIARLRQEAQQRPLQHLSESERLVWAALWKAYPHGVRYCGSDPLLFLSVGLYFAFCAANHQRCRAPEDWPALKDRVLVPGTRRSVDFDGFVDTVRKSLRRGGAFGQPGEVVSEVLNSAAERLRVDLRREYLPAPSTLNIKRFLDHITGRARSDTVPVDVASRIAGADRAGVTEEFADFEGVVRHLSEQLAGGPFREIMGKRAKMRLRDPWGLASEKIILDGKGLGNMTLGGAWLVYPALVYLNSNDPDRCPEWYFDAFVARDKLPTDQYVKRFIEGIRASVEQQGGYALFVEHPFHPRVLWEVLPGIDGAVPNVRYPAEKFVLREFFRRLSEGALSRECASGQVQFLWSHDMLPMVGPAEADSLAGEGQVDVPRIGDVAVSEYAAFGRTNQYNLFLDVDALSEVLTARVANESDPGLVVPRAFPREEFVWSCDEDGAKQNVLQVLNARTSAVNSSEFMRRQIQMNWLLSLSLDEIPLLGASDLLSLPWWSIRRAASAIEPYVWGRAGDLAPLDRAGTFFPLLADPYTWRGIGFATLMATEATIGTVMLATLSDLWKRSRRSQAKMGYQLALRECVYYADDEFVPTVIPKMLALLKRVSEVVTMGPEDCREFEQARDRIETSQDIMSDVLKGVDADSLRVLKARRR